MLIEMKYHQIRLQLVIAITGFIITTSSPERCKQFFCNDADIFISPSFRKYMEVKAMNLQKIEHLNRGKLCPDSSVTETLEASILLSKEKNMSSLTEKFSNGKRIWWLGVCGGNITVALATNNIDCFSNKLRLNDSIEDVNLNLLKAPRRFELFHFVSEMISFFNELISINDKIKMGKYREKVFNKLVHKCRLVNYEMFETTTVNPSINVSNTTDSSLIESTINIGFTSTSIIVVNLTTLSGNATEKPQLTKHSHHGDIPYLLISLICTICGGSCLSFLLCFRRTRHMICTCCSLCKEANRYTRLFDDP